MKKEINDYNVNASPAEGSPQAERQMPMDVFLEIRSKIMEGTANEEENELFNAHLTLLFEQDVQGSMNLSRSELRERESMYENFLARVHETRHRTDTSPSMRTKLALYLRGILVKALTRVQLRYTIVATTLGLAAIVVLVGLFSFYKNTTQPTQITFSPSTHAPSSLVLPDSSIVTLSKGSEICYASDFQKKRIISLKGEAHFDVTKDATRPFQVKFDALSITVTGTKFHVTSSPGSLYDTVVVSEGSVRVSNGARETAVLAGQRLIFDKKNDFFMLDIFIFNNATLEEATVKIAKYFHVNFKWQKDCLKYVPVSAGYLEATSLDRAVHSLTRATGAAFRRKDDVITIDDRWNACRYSLR